MATLVEPVGKADGKKLAVNLRVISAAHTLIELSSGVKLLLPPRAEKEDGHIIMGGCPLGDGGGVPPADALRGDIGAEIGIKGRLAPVDALRAHISLPDKEIPSLGQGQKNQKSQHQSAQCHPQNLSPQGIKALFLFSQFDSPFPRRYG